MEDLTAYHARRPSRTTPRGEPAPTATPRTTGRRGRRTRPTRAAGGALLDEGTRVEIVFVDGEMFEMNEEEEEEEDGEGGDEVEAESDEADAGTRAGPRGGPAGAGLRAEVAGHASSRP